MQMLITALCRAVLAGLLVLLAPAIAGAADLTVVYRFVGGPGGANPAGPLVMDHAGEIFGAASGVAGHGAVIYRLSPNGSGPWQETVLHSFTGSAPPNPGLTLGHGSVLYGNDVGAGGHGFVYRLAPPAGGTGPWSYSVLFDFPGMNAAGGGEPYAGLLLDRRGDIFGTTLAGGAGAGHPPCACGVVYELSPAQPGPWHETVLHAFGNPPDGGVPAGGLTAGPDGTLFGTTTQGGTGRCLDGSGVVIVGCGTVFSLGGTGGTWHETTLYSFKANEENGPTDTLTLGPDGALYGIATLDVYRLTPPKIPGGLWRKLVLYEFPGGYTGIAPAGAVVFDSAGNLYGTTRSFGGAGKPTAFRLSPPATQDAPWNETTLFIFPRTNGFEAQPQGALIRGKGNVFYGTVGAGNGQKGYVFSFRP